MGIKTGIFSLGFRFASNDNSLKQNSMQSLRKALLNLCTNKRRWKCEIMSEYYKELNKEMYVFVFDCGNENVN